MKKVILNKTSCTYADFQEVWMFDWHMVVTLILQVTYVDLAISFYMVFQLKLDEISHKQVMFYLIMCLFKSLLNVAIVSDLWSNLNFHTEKIKGIKIAALKKNWTLVFTAVLKFIKYPSSQTGDKLCLHKTKFWDSRECYDLILFYPPVSRKCVTWYLIKTINIGYSSSPQVKCNHCNTLASVT